MEHLVIAILSSQISKITSTYRENHMENVSNMMILLLSHPHPHLYYSGDCASEQNTSPQSGYIRGKITEESQ